MGQQQLILLVLATVIVGVATVVGIDAFGRSSTQANLDALTQEALAIASDIQAWEMKPEMFGGGAESENAATFSDLGYETNESNDYVSPSGTFSLSGNTITATNDQHQNQISVTVPDNTTSSPTVTIDCQGGEGDDCGEFSSGGN